MGFTLVQAVTMSLLVFGSIMLSYQRGRIVGNAATRLTFTKDGRTWQG